jgi:hypothetical protein
MSKFRTRQLALVLSVAAVAAAGCGSSSSSKSKPASPAASTPATPSTPSTTGTTAASPAAFSAQLNTLCKQFLAAPDSQTPSYVAKFKALTPTAEQKADYEKFQTALDAAITAGHANSQADLKKASQETQAAAKALNAPECTK